MTDTYAIVGGGLAGAKAAEALREEGFDGRIVLICEEPELPYERPPLSKGFLRGEKPREDAHVHDARFYDDHDIELRAGERVTSLDAGRRELELESGERLRFERALLATGAAPRRLNVPGADLDGVHLLRTLADSEALRARLEPGRRLAVVGAGWIGAEVAASARQLGVEVTMIDPLSAPLERVLGPKVAAIYRDVHAEHGVELRLGTGVSAIEGRGSVERVVVDRGDPVECDTVVIGVGVTPRTELAEAAGLDVGDGILVDERLETSAPGIYAAGDVANHRHPRFGRLRIEHWANALNQGLAAGRAMLGAPEPYERIPYFFSDQYDVGMEYSGHAPSWDEVVFRGDPATREFIAYWLEDGRVLAGMNVNVWDVVDEIQALIGKKAPEVGVAT